MITYEYLKFLNLEWWYCLVFSLFGGKCTTVESVSGNVPDASLSVPSVASSSPSSVSFWDWLFGSAAHGGGEYTGPFAAIVNALAPLFAVLGGFLGALWAFYSALAYTLSGILILLIIGAALGLLFIRYRDIELYGTLPPKPLAAGKSRSRWQTLLDKAISPDPKAWRAAVLEADVMLGEALEKIGYSGASTAERIRQVPEGAFVTLPNAWEAHRIRNFVSIRSSDFILTQREAFRVMKLYEQVLEEFDLI